MYKMHILMNKNKINIHEYNELFFGITDAMPVGYY